MARRPLRPYVSSISKFDFHIEENEERVKEISEFLVKSGKVRLNAIERKETPPSSSKSTITIGLRQTLKAFYKRSLRWIILDSEVISPSSISHVFGLLATTNIPSDVSFYVFKDFSSILSSKLKVPRVSAVGFGSDCDLTSFFDHCTPIEISSKTKTKTPKTSSNFLVPELHQPIGKSKDSSKKKQKKNNSKKP
ncbi:hypothetical protein FO519_006325 [Halicephalobus sp. NKZ332]|nr:hypothetical protein FO519_006325 [Halicephalobus sp. NKZ332]